MTEEAPKKTRKRFTLEEKEARLQSELKEIELRRKGEAMRLVSDAHDTLKEALSLSDTKPHAAALQGSLTVLATVITALGK